VLLSHALMESVKGMVLLHARGLVCRARVALYMQCFEEGGVCEAEDLL
jgi:hypothetical protein